MVPYPFPCIPFLIFPPLNLLSNTKTGHVLRRKPSLEYQYEYEIPRSCLFLRRDFDCDFGVDVGLGISGQARLGLERDQGHGFPADADADGDGDHHERMTDAGVYSTPYTLPQDTRQPRAPELGGTSSMNGQRRRVLFAGRRGR